MKLASVFGFFSFSGLISAAAVLGASPAQAHPSSWQYDKTESIQVATVDLHCPSHLKIVSEFNGSKLGFADRRYQVQLRRFVDNSRIDIQQNKLRYEGFLKGYSEDCAGKVDFSNRDFERHLNMSHGVLSISITRKNGEPLSGKAENGLLVYETKNVLRNPPYPSTLTPRQMIQLLQSFRKVARLLKDL